MAIRSDVESFTNDDKLIEKLYKEVIYYTLDMDNTENIKVSGLIDRMHELISRGELRSKEIDFSNAINRCGYLTLYGTCHTGLVKKAIWNFFQRKKCTIFNTNQLTVVSLGGGPGYDLVGFCSALQETPNDVKEIQLKVMDNKEWVAEFKVICKTAKVSDFGSLSKILKDIKFPVGFLGVEFDTDGIFENEAFFSRIGKADFILMVKLESSLSNYCDKKLIKHVVDTMKVGSKFIFIYKLKNDLFDDISSVLTIYDGYEEYKVSCNPLECCEFSTSSDRAHISVFQKK